MRARRGAPDDLGDYGLPTPGADNAAPAIAALIHGDVGSAIDLQPAAPFAALAGGDEVWRYRLGALACLPAARSCSGSRSPRP